MAWPVSGLEERAGECWLRNALVRGPGSILNLFNVKQQRVDPEWFIESVESLS